MIIVVISLVAKSPRECKEKNVIEIFVVWKKMGKGGNIILTVVYFDGKIIISSGSCWIQSWKVVDVGGG